MLIDNPDVTFVSSPGYAAIMANPKLNEVKTKFNALIEEVKNLRVELSETREEVKDLKQQLAAKYEEVTMLQDSLSDRNIAEAVVGRNGQEVNEAKHKIAELMREIDRCIALLNV